ncbi:Fatty acid desaturase, type 2, partial [mine drainage metagenome]
RHMLWNNVVLLGAWTAMSAMCGPARFFVIYILTVSIAGGAGIVLFTVQHNFKHSYASDSAHWNIDTAAIEGTSYLVLPRWLNWCTVDIGYHHVHHLSASIPNYHLAECHREYEHLFAGHALAIGRGPRRLAVHSLGLACAADHIDGRVPARA